MKNYTFDWIEFKGSLQMEVRKVLLFFCMVVIVS